MARPVKWSRDLHPIRESAAHSRTETWSRVDIERLFGVGRASAQALMKAIGEVQTVGGTHFVDRTSLLRFLDEMTAADSVEAALRNRLLEADAPPSPRPLRVALPADLRSVTVRDLPDSIRLSAGRLEIDAPTTEAMLENLVLLAQAMTNDLGGFRAAVEIRPPLTQVDDDLAAFLVSMRRSMQPQ